MGKLTKKEYENLLEPMQVELNNLARWLQHTGARMLVLVEGRDTAGKGGLISAIAERLNPRQVHIVGLGKTDRSRADAVVLPALRFASACSGRARAVRSKLVQPRRRRKSDGLLHAQRV